MGGGSKNNKIVGWNHEFKNSWVQPMNSFNDRKILNEFMSPTHEFKNSWVQPTNFVQISKKKFVKEFVG